MAMKNSRPRAGGAVQRSPVAVARSVSNALREEAERDWAKSDRQAAEGRRRKQSAAAKGRAEATKRDAKIGPPKGKPAPAKGGGRRRKSDEPPATAPGARAGRR